jgi:hypothetical protein
VRDDAEKTMFTVSGLPEGARMRLGTMDAYNGMVYNVSDEGAGSSSAFTQIRSNMSADAQGTPATLRVEVGDMTGVWLPDAGAVTSVTFEGDRAEELRRAAHYNEGTGTAVVTAGLRPDDAYTLETLLPVERSDESLEGAKFAPLSMPKREDVPPGLADIASKAVADADTPIEQVRALQTMLSEGGFFSHGLEGQALSRAGHGAERIATLVGGDQMVGDDEQYAVTMALMAGELGIPARVVMGFYPDEDQAQKGVFAANGISLLSIAVLMAPFIVIAALKAKRRRERLEAERAADRISGGWDELVDRAVDFGTPVRPGATRAEDADVVGTAFEEPRVATLARRADVEVFGPTDPTPTEVEEFWRQVDEIVDGMRERSTFWGRVRAGVSMRSLLVGTRFALRPPKARAPRERGVDAAADQATGEDARPGDEAPR